MRAVSKSGAIGAILAGLLAGWALLSHPGAPGSPGMAGVILGGVLAWGFGAALARSNPLAPGIAVAAAVGLAIVLTLPGSMSGGATAPPLGYANADAALITSAVAGLLGAAAHAGPHVRPRLLGAAFVFSLASLVIGSRAGTAVCVLLWLAWPLLSHGRVRLWQAAAATTLAAAVGLTVTLGVTYDTGSSDDDVVDSTLSVERTALWADAIHLASEDPVLGIGPGAFDGQSRTAQASPELDATHSTPLQISAELGLVGVALLGALVLWMIVALGRGAVVLALLTLQPTVDYVLDFPAVVVASGVVLGAIAASGIGKPGFTPPAP